ncbi:hypothetical protein ARMGADRAFT_1030891 [Armillaria gallica]|uniref:Uncharacterized protein n=1 Tax=Armillaria gallica TaxID=47427 RepID=A0A2H3DBP4_ARMGA|nr:hypothetical protein ARMGADRAFT_1030891 [Armillaria gallica]
MNIVANVSLTKPFALSTAVSGCVNSVVSRRLEDKMETVMEQVEDLMDNYHVNYNVKYLDDFVSKSVKAEFEALRMELWKTSNIYREVLCVVAQQRPDWDIALIKAEGLQTLSTEMPLSMDDLYKILNKSFWIETVSTASLHKQMPVHNKFLQAHQNFYNVHRLLKDQEGYRVKDSGKPLDLEKKIHMNMIPGAESINILDLNPIIKIHMPELYLEEKVEKELQWQAIVRMRAYKVGKG